MKSDLERLRPARKHCFTMCNTEFEVDRKYIPLKVIGRGSYGMVCSSYNRDTDERVAIKKIFNVFENRTCAIRTLREVMLLRRIQHENIVPLKDVMMPSNFSGFRDLYLIYELMDTDLHRIIQSPQPLSNDHCRFFIFQLLRGLSYLHSVNILHRDLKPGNILINSNMDLKICDFGLSRTGCVNGELMTEYVVTRWYRAPELLLSCDKYGSPVDIWSVGCILAEILGRKPIFPGTNKLTQLQLIVDVLGTQSEAAVEFIDKSRPKAFVRSLTSRGTRLSSLYPDADPLAIDLLERLLVFDPSKRITATDALYHPYIFDLHDPTYGSCDKYQRLDLKIDENAGEAALREMMLKEILPFHPELVMQMHH